MIHLRRSILALILDLFVLFNIERFELGGTNRLDLASFVYLLTVVAVAAVLLIPLFRRFPAVVSVVVWVAIYALLRFTLFNQSAVLEGANLYLAITEATFLVVTVLLTRQVAIDLYDFEQTIENITLSRFSTQVRRLDEAMDDVQTEMLRSRRHHRPLSVVVVEPDPESVQANLHRTVQEVQRAMIGRYVVTSLARTIGSALRRTDTVLKRPDQDRFIILSPETNVTSSAAVVERIQQAAMNQMGIKVTCGVASFPDHALTFEELVSQAELFLQHAHDLPQPADAVASNAQQNV